MKPTVPQSRKRKKYSRLFNVGSHLVSSSLRSEISPFGSTLLGRMTIPSPKRGPSTELLGAPVPPSWVRVLLIGVEGLERSDERRRDRPVGLVPLVMSKDDRVGV
ncbi:BQ5605_C001g00596 [Microbotryum silenes-dioicae]|uniref:BQ5605_C001g00596 protein n=1 Tax=Microbotryum silenes-dioicae TaxID=796604 RepID=A0A2X0P6I9_9BASI|nr:BQ5605_C001g00596 [Microbotryum silenes-dioicae]